MSSVLTFGEYLGRQILHCRLFLMLAAQQMMDECRHGVPIADKDRCWRATRIFNVIQAVTDSFN
jgi:hypothetical protein